jgi:hypothetical protein
MESVSQDHGAPAPATSSFFAHLGAAGALGLVAAQASLFIAGLIYAALGLGNDSRILGLDPLICFCALPLVVWVVITGGAFTIIDRAPSADRRSVPARAPHQ